MDGSNLSHIRMGTHKSRNLLDGELKIMGKKKRKEKKHSYIRETYVNQPDIGEQKEDTNGRKYSFFELYSPTSLVLIVEERTCRSCGEKKTTNSLSLLIEYSSNHAPTTLILKHKDDKIEYEGRKYKIPAPPANLPQKVQKVHVNEDACFLCFFSTQGEQEQMSLFSPISRKRVKNYFTREMLREDQKYSTTELERVEEDYKRTRRLKPLVQDYKLTDILSLKDKGKTQNKKVKYVPSLDDF